jgi:hypothetical protein
MSLWKALRELFRRAIPPLVESDAQALIHEHGAQAYGVARWRAHQLRHGKLVDDSRPDGHWHAVSRRVADLVGHQIGIDNATRRLDDD